MSGFFDFAPDPVRAVALDARMHAGLADSLDHIVEEARALEGLNTDAIRSVAKAIRAGQQFGPTAFARYYDLVLALLDRRYEDAVAASNNFSALTPFDGQVRVATMDEAVIGEDAVLYRERMGREADGRYIAPPDDLIEPFVDLLDWAVGTVEQLLPDFAGEYQALVRRIVLSSAPHDGPSQYCSASAYMLWGLMILNPMAISSRVHLLEVLAHEAAHLLLFGFTYEEPLVLNDDAESHVSPLRDDPRPMDGVFHATFVTARVHLAMARLADSRGLDPTTRAEAAKSVDRQVAIYEQGLATIEGHASLSETGAALLKAAKDYMAAAA